MAYSFFSVIFDCLLITLTFVTLSFSMQVL